jgi:4-methyl-5(b-hydroxyethyl)-thiazole monophosphate biosynthesis
LKKVLLYLPKGFEELEAAAFTDVMGWSRVEGLEPVYITTAGMHDQVRCTWSFTVLPDLMLHNVAIADYDALVLPGGFEEAGYYEDVFDERVSETILLFYEAEKWIAAVCVGALPLGHAGILKGRRATTYHLGEGKRRKQLADFGAEVVDQRIVESGRVMTSTAPETAIDVAFRLLERLTGPENVRRVRRAMGFDGPE